MSESKTKSMAIEPKKKQTEIIEHKPANDFMRLIESAVNKQLPVEQLKELMLLKKQYDADNNKIEFYNRFAQFQAEIPPIHKTREVHTNSGQLAYKYASLDDILKQVKPVLARHGFVYQWTEGISEAENCKRISCTISGWGHSITSFVDMPAATGTQMTNAIQLEGSRNTYGKRYSFCAVTGVNPEDDNDGQTADDKQPQKKASKPDDSAERKEYIKNARFMWDNLRAAGYTEGADNYETLEKFMKGLKDWKTADLKKYTSLMAGIHKAMNLDNVGGKK